MTDQLPPPTDSTKPWWKRRWGMIYLSLLGITLLIAVVQAAQPRRREELAGLAKAGNLIPVAIALDVLFAIGIFMMVTRSRFWRSRGTNKETLLGCVLLLLGIAAAVVFVFFGCWAVSDF